MRRIVNPSFVFLQVEFVEWNDVIEAWLGAGQVSEGDLPAPNPGETSDPYRPTLSLRWYTHPKLGLSRRPFQLWIRNPSRRGNQIPLQPLSTIPFRGDGMEVVTWWGEHMAIVEVEVDAWGPAVVRAEGARYHDAGAEPVDSSTIPMPGRHTVTLRGSGLRSVVIEGAGTVVGITGITTQALASLPGWLPVEVVGLPVDRRDPGPYEGLSQGPIDALVDPISAALARLTRGAPRFGWPPRNDRGVRMPDYRWPDFHKFVEELGTSSVKHLVDMLSLGLPTQQHEQWYTSHPVTSSGSTDMSMRQHPLLTALAAATADPLAALALGYGTAWDGSMLKAFVEPSALFDYHVMLTLPHERFEDALGAEFAALAFPRRTLPPSEDYWPVTTHRGEPRPPVSVDRPYRQTVDLQWPHPPRRSPRAFAVVEGTPGSPTASFINRERPSGGWVPTLAASKPEQPVVTPLQFDVPVSGTAERVYSVAASDPFGRWTPWRSTVATLVEEAAQRPTLIKARIELGKKPPGILFYSFPALETADGRYRNGLLAVDFTWDWSLRTPSMIEFSGEFLDPNRVRNGPPPPVFDDGFGVNPPSLVRVKFQGDRPVVELSGCVVECRSPDWETVVDPGPDQVGPSGGVRGYRLYVPIRLVLLDRLEIGYRVWALGRRIIAATPSPWSEPVTARLDNPRSPSLPVVREAPQWSSLPDVSGRARARLQWTAPGSGMPVDHYVLYEATESALRDAAGLAATAPEASFAERIAALRAIDPSVARRVFTRTAAEPLRGLEREVVLPRGTRLIHMYVVTTVSPNNVESGWPLSSTAMMAVAVPHRAVPDAPTLELQSDPSTGRIVVRLRARKVPALDRIELFRTDREPLSFELETMGRPITSSTQPGWSVADDGDSTVWTYTDAPPGAAFSSVFYRAVAWSADDEQTGARTARSLSTPRRSIVAPSLTAPAIQSPTAVFSGNVVRLSWTSDAPPRDTEVGPFRLRVLVRAPDRQAPIASHESVLHRARVGPGAKLGELTVTPNGTSWTYALELDVGPSTKLAVSLGLRDPSGRTTNTAVHLERSL